MRLNTTTTFNTWTWEDYSLYKTPTAQHTTCKFCCKHSLVIQLITNSKQKSMAEQLTVHGWVEQRWPAKRKWLVKKISSARDIARSLIRENNHSPPPIAEVKNECSYTSTPPTCFHAVSMENFIKVRIHSRLHNLLLIQRISSMFGIHVQI